MNPSPTEKPLPTLSAVQERLVRKALIRTKGNVRAAAQLIDVPKTTMYRYVKLIKSKDVQ